MAIKSLKSGSYGRSVMAGNSLILPGDYESIATVSVGAGGQSTISFSSIPQTFTHLQVRGIGRTNRADTLDYYKIQFNTDTGSNYAWNQIYGSGATAAGQSGSTATEIRAFRVAGANDAANIFGLQIIDILDYKNTNKYKTVKCLGGQDNNGSGEISFSSGLWQSNNAITSIEIKPGGGTNWVQYSHFALYGVK